jgi:hypothetical protein
MNGHVWDPFGRHAGGTLDSRFIALAAALITGSVWPAFARSDRAALDIWARRRGDELSSALGKVLR